MANARQGTSATKTRRCLALAENCGSRRNRPRAYCIVAVSALEGWRHVHGPQPRDWSYNMPRKMRQGACARVI